MLTRTRIKQHDITDCGAACLTSVAAHYKLHLPIARVRQYAGTDQKGTNMLGLIEACDIELLIQNAFFGRFGDCVP